MDKITYLQDRLFHFKEKYSNHPRYCAFRMVFASLYALLLPIGKIKKEKQYTVIEKSKKIPTVVFYIKGGLGDLIIATNYIYCVHQYIKEMPVKIKISYPSRELLNFFCALLPGVVEKTTKVRQVPASVSIELNRFPRILSGDLEEIKQYNSKLAKLFDSWNTFFAHNRKFFDLMPQIDGLGNNYTELLGAKRINQADIGGFLNVGEDYLAPLPYPSLKKEQQILKKFGLNVKEFITINRGQSLTSNTKVNNKLWPVAYYDNLIAKIKQYFGDKYLIVQIGSVRKGFSENFKNIDLDLLGKTNFEELKVLLKRAKIHIDSEGGLVHLRHAIKGGKSVVLFGPTSPAIYGYSENLNLRSSACPHPCEWVVNDWLSRCPRRNQKHICMKKLTPQIVFEEIKKLNL